MIRRAIGVLEFIDRLIHGESESKMPSCEVFVREAESPLSEENARAHLVEAAMSLTDDDTFGYLMLVLKKPEPGSTGEINVHAYVQPEWWPAFIEVMDRAEKVALSLARDAGP